MGQTSDEITQNLAERLCWETAGRDDSRVGGRPGVVQPSTALRDRQASSCLDGGRHPTDTSQVVTPRI
jgi:hypothetical protein